MTACARPVGAAPSLDWAGFKGRFVMSDGRVVDTGNAGVSHSEGQGFALLMAVNANDRETFDRMWLWTNATLSRRDTRLFAWRYDPAPGKGVTDPNNATDGDIFIAWALQIAGARWKQPAYTRAAGEIRTAIATRLVAPHGNRLLLLPGLDGFVHADGSKTVNPSYLVFPALEAFARVDPNGPWRQVIEDGRAIVREARFGPLDLPIDWVRVDPKGQLWSEPGRAPRFGFDAVRVPLYLRWAGYSREPAIAAASAWWRQASSLGRQIPAWVDVTNGTTADFPASVGVARIADYIDDGKVSNAPLPAAADYYASALYNLATLAARSR